MQLSYRASLPSVARALLLHFFGSGALMCKRLLSPALFLICASSPGQTVLNVKDPNASVVDVKLRRTDLANAQTPRLKAALSNLPACVSAPVPTPPPPGQGIPPHYLKDSHGPTDPAERVASEPYLNLQRIAAWGADRYLVTGDPAEASCVVEMLLPWARAHAMLQYNAKADRQLWYQSEWTIGSLALAISVIRAEPSLNRAERDEVISWLDQAAKKLVSEDQGPISSRNNHSFWRGLAATATGVISGDDELFKLGVSTYATAIGEIAPDGSFPLEMQRHELALHYQAFAIQPLVMIAQLAIRQGYNLFPLTENKRQLSDAVAFLSRAIADPTLVKQYASEPQEMGFDPGTTQLSWLEFWNRAEPSSTWNAHLTKPFFNSRLGGSTTLYAAPVSEESGARVPAASAPAARKPEPAGVN